MYNRHNEFFFSLDCTSRLSTIEHDRNFISAYEKGHQRPPLTVYTFQAPDQSLSQPSSPVTSTTPSSETPKIAPSLSPAPSVKSLHNKPPLPTVSRRFRVRRRVGCIFVFLQRCSSLERPSGPNLPAKTIAGMAGVRVLPPGAENSLVKKPSPLPTHIAKGDFFQ